MYRDASTVAAVELIHSGPSSLILAATEDTAWFSVAKGTGFLEPTIVDRSAGRIDGITVSASDKRVVHWRSERTWLVGSGGMGTSSGMYSLEVGGVIWSIAAAVDYRSYVVDGDYIQGLRISVSISISIRVS